MFSSTRQMWRCKCSVPPAHRVHPVQGVGKQSCLFPTHSGPDLHNNIFIIIWVFGQEQELKLLLKLFHLRFGLKQLLLSQFLHLWIGQQFLGLGSALPGSQISSIGFHHRTQFILLLIQTCLLYTSDAADEL